MPSKLVRLTGYAELGKSSVRFLAWWEAWSCPRIRSKRNHESRATELLALSRSVVTSSARRHNCELPSRQARAAGRRYAAASPAVRCVGHHRSPCLTRRTPSVFLTPTERRVRVEDKAALHGLPARPSSPAHAVQPCHRRATRQQLRTAAGAAPVPDGDPVARTSFPLPGPRRRRLPDRRRSAARSRASRGLHAPKRAIDRVAATANCHRLALSPRGRATCSRPGLALVRSSPTLMSVAVCQPIASNRGSSG